MPNPRVSLHVRRALACAGWIAIGLICATRPYPYHGPAEMVALYTCVGAAIGSLFGRKAAIAGALAGAATPFLIVFLDRFGVS